MDPTPATRASLIVKLRDTGDENAWSEFVAIYEPFVYRLARQKGLQDADARRPLPGSLPGGGSGRRSLGARPGQLSRLALADRS